MSFENQYIEKYGQKAVETYKRSLRHSDEKEESPKEPAGKQRIKHSSSCSRYQQLSKSKIGEGKSRKPSPKVVAGREKKIASNSHNTVQLYLQPAKKRLVISDISTPKQTPSKARFRKNSQKLLANTNVNVYVQAMNRSKSKQSTPCKEKLNSRVTSSKPNSCQLVGQVISALGEVDSRADTEMKNVRKCVEMLESLQIVLMKQAKKKAKLESKVRKMRELIGCSRKKESASMETSHSDYICQLQSQLSSYQQQEQSLLRIIQSLSGRPRNFKEMTPQSQPVSSEESDKDQS